MALRVWLPLNGNLNNQGLSNITPVNHDCTIGEGKIGNCYVFNGSTSYIDMGDSFSDIIKGYGQPFSIAFWLKSLEDGTRGVLFSTFPNTGNLNFLSLEENAGGVTTNALRFDWKQDYDIYIHNFFDLGKWVHATITYDGNQTISFYKNGELKDTKTKQLGIIENPPKNFWLGNDVRLGATSLNGSMNDFRLYDECLTPKQVKEISKGLVAHYPLKGTECNPNLLSNTKTFEGWSVGSGWIKTIESDGTAMYSFSRTGATANTWVRLIPTYHIIPSNFPNGIAVSFDFMVDDLDALNKQIICALQNYNDSGTKTSWVETNGLQYYINGDKVVSGQWIRLTKLWTQAELSQGTGTTYSTLSFQLVQNGSIHIKNVKCEAGNTPTNYIPNSAETKYSALGYDKVWIDEDAGYGYEGKQSGTLSFNPDSPRYEGSTKFNAGYLHEIPSPLHANSDAFTISCWFYPTASGTQAIINDRKSVGDGLSVFYYTGTQMRFDTGGSYQWVVSASDFGLNKWNFLTFVWDKNEGIKKYYLNGNLINSTTSYGTIANIGDVYSIGNSSTNGAAGAGNQVYGSISDFRIYSTALSDNDIKELYQTSAMVDNQGNSYAYEFKEE